MSEVIVQEQQLQFVNIVEIVQTNLSKNFALVLKRLNHHDTVLAQCQLNNLSTKQANSNQTLELQNKFLEHKNQIAQRFQEIVQKLQALADNHASLKTFQQENRSDLKQLNEQVFKNQVQFVQKIKQKEKETLQITRHVKLLALEQNRLNDEINKKENRVQAEKIFKQTEILKDKNQHIESDLKIAHHKLQKMEILNEKAERMQAKKEIQIFKQIQERVKKQIKSNLNSPIIPSFQQAGLTSITMISNPAKTSQVPTSGSSSPPFIVAQSEKADSDNPQQFERQKRRASIFIEEHANVGIRGNIDVYLEKWGEKMRVFEEKVKEMSQNIKILNKSIAKKESRQNKQNNQDAIKEKINELKPQVVKLWAKLDTIDDRVSFNERKLDQRMKSINQLTSMIKQNNLSRLQEKVKNMQTEIFTGLKQIKAKLETKVNQTDYDKYVKCMDDKIVQINELIYLKSDKLEVKKALLFLQSKIKEIILVISQDEQNQKDALLTKKQLKCISCDKQIDKLSGIVTSPKGNWDGLPFKDHPSEVLGRFGMTSYGSLSKKIKKLQSKDLPILNKRSVNHSFQISSN